MKFSSLNPMLTHTPPAKWHQLRFDCPTCLGKIIAIHVSLDGEPKGEGIWGLRLADDFSWDGATIVPSINNTSPLGHGRKSPCSAHLSVTKGEVGLNNG